MNTVSKKCLVLGCANHTHEGRFVGDLCGPCHEMITTGYLSQGTTWIHDDIKYLEEWIENLLTEGDELE